MFNIEITPLVKTEIRPVPEAQLHDQLYRIFLDKGVHFRVEQVNDESIVFYWTHTNDYLYTIVKEIGELLNPVAENAKVKATEAEQPKVDGQQWPVGNDDTSYVNQYDVEMIEKIKEALNILYPDALYISQKYDMLAFRMKEFDPKIMKAIRIIVSLIVKDAVRLISVRDIGKEDADEIMRGAVHEYQGKIRGSNYVDGTLTVLVDNDPDVIKWFEEPYSFTYTGPKAKVINDTLTAIYSSRVETKLESERLTIKFQLGDLSLQDEIHSLIDEFVNNRLRLLTINTIGEEDADLFMGEILHTFPEKVRQWTYTDNTLTILLNYEPGLIENLERRLEDLSLKRFLKDGARSVLKGLFSDCNCPICQKHR
ncbi:hypothetical protein GQU84_003982 [Salmonella enterica]|nr:hypothetical protein [Salmonella enterica]